VLRSLKNINSSAVYIDIIGVGHKKATHFSQKPSFRLSFFFRPLNPSKFGPENRTKNDT
jgi:hypothetical protein